MDLESGRFMVGMTLNPAGLPPPPTPTRKERERAGEASPRHAVLLCRLGFVSFSPRALRSRSLKVVLAVAML